MKKVIDNALLLKHTYVLVKLKHIKNKCDVSSTPIGNVQNNDQSSYDSWEKISWISRGLAFT